MLPAPHRMRRPETFRAAVRSGVRAGRRHLVVHLLLPAAARDEAASGAVVPTRVGLVVSRPVGSAAVRTTVKRRLRHLAAARLDVLPPGSSLVVRATPAAAGRSSAVLGSDLDAALTTALRSATRAGGRRGTAVGAAGRR